MGIAEKLGLDRRNDLFPPKPNRYSDDPVQIDDIPHMSRPVTEFVHKVQPDAVFAADRGGRFLGLAVLKSWKYLYPKENFASRDGRIHFGRWSRSVDWEDFNTLTGFALAQSGLTKELERRKTEGVSEPVRIVLLDDWTCQGNNMRRFEESLLHNNLVLGEDSEFFAATMCGPRNGIVDVVGDPDRNPRHSSWNNKADMVGIDYGYTYSDSPIRPHVIEDWLCARQNRHQLYEEIDSYYSRYAARNTGIAPPEQMAA